MHFGKSPKSTRFGMSQTMIWAKAMVPPLSVVDQAAFSDNLWDNNASIDKTDDAAVGTFTDDNHNAGATNNRAGTYSEPVNNAALRFGICFTTKQYHKNKSLQILSDASALKHCL
jgi:hypothetical protein